MGEHKDMNDNLQALLPHAHNVWHGLIIGYVSDYFGERWSNDRVSKIIKLCYYHVVKKIQIHWI